MALTFFWRCEGTTLSGTDDYVESGGDTTPTAGGSPSIAAGGAFVGTNGIIATVGTNYRFDTTTAVFDRTVGSFGMLFRANTWYNGARVIMIRGSAAANQYSIELTGAGEIVAKVGDPDGATVDAATTTASLATDTDYGVIMRWDQPNSLLRIEVYSDPLGTPTLIQGVTNSSGFTAPADLVAGDRFRIGENSGGGGSFDIDNIFVSKVYAEPIEDNFGITSYTEYGSVGGGSVVYPSLLLLGVG